MTKKKLAFLSVILISILVLSGCGSSGGGTSVSYGDVYGTIVDDDSNSVEGSTVTISSKETTTGSAGGFTIKELKTGTYTIEASKYSISTGDLFTETVYDFHNTAKKEISISDGANSIGNIVLKPKFIVNNLNSYYDSLGLFNVTGRIKNNSSEFIDYIEINIKLYNSNDERIGSSFTNMTEVSSGEVINWEIITDYDGAESNIASYKLDVSYSIY